MKYLALLCFLFSCKNEGCLTFSYVTCDRAVTVTVDAQTIEKTVA